MEVCQQERLEKLQACASQGKGLSNGGCVGCLFWFQWSLLRVLLGNLGSWRRESQRKVAFPSVAEELVKSGSGRKEASKCLSCRGLCLCPLRAGSGDRQMALSVTFPCCFLWGKVPEDWRMADATAAFRKGVEDGVCNLEVGWPHVCSWGGDATACCRCHCHVTGGEGICKEQSRWMDRGEVMPDQKVALCVVLIVQ